MPFPKIASCFRFRPSLSSIHLTHIHNLASFSVFTICLLGFHSPSLSSQPSRTLASLSSRHYLSSSPFHCFRLFSFPLLFIVASHLFPSFTICPSKTCSCVFKCLAFTLLPFDTSAYASFPPNLPTTACRSLPCGFSVL